VKHKFYFLPLIFVFCAALAVALIGAGVNPPRRMKHPAPTRHKAEYWKKAGKGAVECLLCPRKCVIRDGQRGFCASRINKGGKLYSLTYGRPVALAMDPIEKKPLFHAFSCHSRRAGFVNSDSRM